MSNKELVRAAMTALFVDRDVTAIDTYWGTDYIQHNPHIPNGHEVLKSIVAGLAPDFTYEPSLVLEDGDFVVIHGRYMGWAAQPMVAADYFRVKDGKLVEHWDVMQKEELRGQTAAKTAMFPIV